MRIPFLYRSQMQSASSSTSSFVTMTDCVSSHLDFDRHRCQIACGHKAERLLRVQPRAQLARKFAISFGRQRTLTVGDVCRPATRSLQQGQFSAARATAFTIHRFETFCNANVLDTPGKSLCFRDVRRTGCLEAQRGRAATGAGCGSRCVRFGRLRIRFGDLSFVSHPRSHAGMQAGASHSGSVDGDGRRRGHGGG